MDLRTPEAAVLMGAAKLWAERGTCNRLQVGAIVSRNGRILSSGYNGNPSGIKHCMHLVDTPCKTAVHAEANAIVAAAKHGISVDKATIWTTHCPCLACASLIINSGIDDVVYELDYRDRSGVELLIDAGVAVYKYEDNNTTKIG